MRTFRVASLVALVAGLTAGCLSVKSYVVPLNPKIEYGDLLARRESRPAALEIAFHRNGEPVNVPQARTEIRAVFERSKLFTAITDTPTPDADQFAIVLDNRADVGEAASKGMLTGITFGGAGSKVTDGYIFTVTFRKAGGEPLTKSYRHFIFSTIGNADGPPDLVAMSTSEAFSRIVEELVLTMLFDLQKEERL